MVRRLRCSAHLFRSGTFARDKVLALLQEPVNCPDELMELVKKRLNFTDEQFAKAMEQEVKTFRSFPNYKGSFERLRPFFAILVAMGRVPKSFYMKFCFRSELGYRSEEHTSELQSLMRISYAGFCLKKKNILHN